MQQHEINAAVKAVLELQAGWDAISDAEKRERWDQTKRIKRTLSNAYGARRGWVQSDDQFPVKALARVSALGEEWPHEFTDHRSFWMKEGRLIAIAAHLYSCDEKRQEAAKIWAASRGLNVVFPADFPSWWYPGRTTLIEITRAS